jgi:hypothetical protein
MADLGGLLYASISWSATVASLQVIAAPSTGKTIELRWLYAYQSAAGSVQLFNGTAAASSSPIWYWIGGNGNLVAEEAAISGADGQAIAMNTGNSYGGGNGVMRAYYRVVPSSGGGANSSQSY